LDLVGALERDEAQGMKVRDLLRALPNVGESLDVGITDDVARDSVQS
jgi:hypothetical protein